MNVKELNKDQMIQLKQNHIVEKNDKADIPTYWSDLANADKLVSDKEIFENYGHIDFVPEDFA